MRRLRRLRCAILGHDLSGGFTQPDPPFEDRWNKYLEHVVTTEIFDHACTRCDASFRVWRMTRRAIEEEFKRGLFV